MSRNFKNDALVVRASDDFDWINSAGIGYEVGISGNGRYYVGKDDNGSFSWLQGWTESPYLETGEALNVIMFGVSGSDIEVYFNGSLAWSGGDSDITGAGRVALVGYSGSSDETIHHFDNVTVGQPVVTGQQIDAAQKRCNDHPIVGGTRQRAPQGATQLTSAERQSARKKMTLGGFEVASAQTTYDVCFGTDNPPTTLLCEDLSSPSCDPGDLTPNTTYYWTAVSKSACGETPGPVWSFTTETPSCAAPPAPDKPNPADGAIMVPTDTDLVWNGSLNAGTAHPLTDLDALGNPKLPRTLQGVTRAEPQAIGDVIKSFASPGSYPFGLAWKNGRLFHTDTIDGDAVTAMGYELSPTDGSILGTFGPIDACEITWDGSNFWGVDPGRHRIVKFSPTWSVVQTYPSPGSNPVGITWDGTSLWVCDWATTRVYEVDPSNMATIRSFAAPDTRVAGMAFDGAALWTNGRDTATTYRISRADGAVLASFSTPPAPGMNNGAGATFDGERLWLANHDVGRLYQIDIDAVSTCPTTYDVYFGTTNPPTTRIASDLTAPAFDPGVLAEQTTFHWQVVAKTSGGETPGPVWSFTTLGGEIEREVRVGPAGGSPGSTVQIPILMQAQGDENALGFSLLFDQAILSNPLASLGSDAAGASLIVNATRAGEGKLGIAVALPAGEVFAAGTQEIVIVTFDIAADTVADSTAIDFGDEPVMREISDADANPLASNWTGGTVTITNPPPAVYNVTPSSGLNNAAVDLGISGKDYRAGATVKLTHMGQADIPATKVTVAKSWSLTCTINLTDKLAGQWHVVVTNDDGLSGSLTNGFTISNAPPTVTTISPNTGINTGMVSITNLTGTGFRDGATVKLQKSGETDILGTNVVVVGPTQITCFLDITGSTTGKWDIVVTNADGQSAVLTEGFEVKYPAPTVTGITSSSGANSGPITITDLAGAFFRDGATALLRRTGEADILATGVTVLSTTKITCTLDLTGKAVGQWDVVVANSDGQTGVLSGGFTVRYPAPTVANVSPASGPNNGIAAVSIGGAGFRAGATVTLERSGQSAIAASDVSVVSATQISCKLDLTGKTTGQWDVVVTNSDGQSGRLENGFTIKYPAPTVAGITPNSGLDTETVNVTDLAGTGFMAGATVKLTKIGEGDTATTDLVVESATKITCKLDLSGKAAGQWNVVVTNTDGQVGTLTNGFTVKCPVPTVTGITPNSGINNGSIGITNVAGTNFRQGATVKLRKSGQNDIVAMNVALTSSSQIACTFDLTGKAVGPWDVVVTNPDGQSATLTDGFTIIVSTVHDIALTGFSASPNPVRRGGTITFSGTVKNLGDVAESGVTFTLTSSGQILEGPISIPTLSSGQQVSGSIKVKVSRNLRPGEYLVTGQLSTVASETNTANNSQTVKVTVR